MPPTIIHATRRDGEDPSTVAAQAAREAGTRIAGNLLYYGPVTTPDGDETLCLAAPTRDGREVRVWQLRRGSSDLPVSS